MAAGWGADLWNRRVFPLVGDYGAGPVSQQVVRIVLSYIDYVNRVIWSKPAPVAPQPDL